MNPAANTREDPGKWGSLALTVFIHGALALLLFYGVQWQRRPPEPVQVDLVRSMPDLPPPVVKPPEPAPRPVPVPAPVPKEVEPPPVKKPDIALPKPPEKPVKKEKPPVEPPKPVEKPKPVPEKVQPAPEPVKPQIDPREREAQRQRDLMNMDLDRLRRKDQEQVNARNKADRDAAAGKVNDKARDEWLSAIKQKVRGKLNMPAVTGDPEAEFHIELLPDGTVASVRLDRSSGNRALDDAIQRAIGNSSPLPLPARPEVFDRNLRFVFKPRGD